MRRSARTVFLLVFCSAALGAEEPVAVSPGDTSKLALIESHCPTFSCGSVARAGSYELVVYRLGEEGEEPQPVLRAPKVGPEGRIYEVTLKSKLLGTGDREVRDLCFFFDASSPGILLIENEQQFGLGNLFLYSLDRMNNHRRKWQAVLVQVTTRMPRRSRMTGATAVTHPPSRPRRSLLCGRTSIGRLQRTISTRTGRGV